MNTLICTCNGQHEKCQHIEALEAENARLREALETAVRWLNQIQAEFPDLLNEGAIEKHLMPALAQKTPSALTEKGGT